MNPFLWIPVFSFRKTGITISCFAIFPNFATIGGMLEVKNLHATHDGKKILNGVDLKVNPGEIHLILGPNGSGKSTLGRVLLGDSQYQKEEGVIKIVGKNVEKLSPSERAKLGFFLSFQTPPELDGVSAKNFLFAAKKSLNPEFASSFKFKKGLEKDLEELDLDASFSNREMNKGFSGGERKKMEIASLLALDPKIAFLDEIDSGVDIGAIKKIGNAINGFLENKEKSLILVSHTEKLLEVIKPQFVHVFCGGKVVATGGPELIGRVHKEGFCGVGNCKEVNR